MNTVFGVVCALAIVRRQFRGKGLLNAFIDLPLALSPVVVGLSLFLLYGQDGWFGSWFADRGIDVLFALPAMVIATIFVSIPFVAREVVPTLREIGDEQEQAARTLGAERLADVLAHHASVHPLGGRLRRDPHDRALSRRVRGRRRRVRAHPGSRPRRRRSASRSATRASTSPARTRSRSCSP